MCDDVERMDKKEVFSYFNVFTLKECGYPRDTCQEQTRTL